MQHGIRARGKRRFGVTTDSGHGLPIAPNLLHRNFTVAAPNQVWTGDMTCIPTNERWLFLAMILDLFRRRILNSSLRQDMPSETLFASLRVERLYGQHFQMPLSLQTKCNTLVRWCCRGTNL